MLTLRPVDLPLLRDEVRDWYLHNPTAWSDIEATLDEDPTHTRASIARAIAMLEADGLAGASLFHVEAAMTAVISASAGSLPQFDLTDGDVPTPSGFMYLGGSLDVATSSTPLAVRAVGWRTYEGQIWTTWYTDREEEIRSADPPMSGQEIAGLRANYCRLRLLAIMPYRVIEERYITTSSGQRQEHDPVIDAITSGDWLSKLKVAWLLMAQPLAENDEVDVSRPAPKQGGRSGRQRPRSKEQVRIIRLRRPPSSSTGTSDREWHHQWIVRGHWRQQWYPARQVHRPVWIAPHVKGPEGKPMLGGEKVYHWKR